MNHPNHEELAAFLYDDELDGARRAELASHVESCAQCRALVESWQGVRARLATWELPHASRRVALPSWATAARGGLRWAVAAVVLLGAGFALARATARPAVDIASLRADLVREVRQEMRQELAAEMKQHAARQVKWQQELEDGVIDALDLLATRQVATYANLRKDVETVALRSHEEYSRLAGLAQPSDGADVTPVEQ